MRQRLFFVLLCAACVPCGQPTREKELEATRAELLGAVGVCARDTARSFLDEATQFAATPTAEAWKRSMRAWQRMEVMQFGPTGPSSAPGGLDLRDHIYSWPLINRCAVEDVLVAGKFDAVSTMLVNRRGLAAAEYLLFSNTVQCGAATWATLSTAEQSARRQAYVQAVAADVKTRAEQLATAWETYAETLRTAGAGNATYPSAVEALNRVTDALFYIEREVKVAKVAAPLGITGCTAPPCLDALESQYAKLNTESIKQNIIAARQLLQGCGDTFEGVGFDDLLVRIGAGALSQKLITQLDAVQAALDALGARDLSEALASDAPAVHSLYEALRVLSVTMKTEFVMVLDLRLPQSLGGDTD